MISYLVLRIRSGIVSGYESTTDRVLIQFVDVQQGLSMRPFSPEMQGYVRTYGVQEYRSTVRSPPRLALSAALRVHTYVTYLTLCVRVCLVASWLVRTLTLELSPLRAPYVRYSVQYILQSITCANGREADFLRARLGDVREHAHA